MQGDPSLAGLVRGARQARAALARQDVNTFVEMVLKDERCGSAVRQAPFHPEWHEFAEQHEKLVLWAHVESAKTQQLSIGRVLWELGRNPSLRFGICMATGRQSEKVVRSIAAIIERSEALRLVFPHLRPSPSGPWTSSALTVERPYTSKDPSVLGFSVHSAVLGSRIDRLHVDDILSPENCATQSLRDDLSNWFTGAALSRLTGDGRVRAYGVALHPDDLLHRLSRQAGWVSHRYGVLGDDGRPRWPQRWPPERIARARETLGPAEAGRSLDCVARDDATATFTEAMIADAIERGQIEGGDEFPRSVGGQLPAGFETFTGVDLAFAQHGKADRSAVVTVASGPNGVREILEVQSGRWPAAETLRRIVDAARRFQSIVWCENVAGQDLMVQFAREVSSISIMPFTTGSGRRSLDFQAQHLAVEMSGRKWAFRNDRGRMHPEMRALVSDLLQYDPRSHCPDRAAALFLARHGCAEGDARIEVAPVSSIICRGY